MSIRMNTYQCDDCGSFFHLEQADEAWPEACPYCGHTSTTWRGDNFYRLEEVGVPSDSLRGWRIEGITFHGKPHFRATRDGVSMNHPTYDGIVGMIMSRVL